MRAVGEEASAELVRLVDGLEARAEGFITLDEVQQAAARDLSDVIADGLLLVDDRQRFDAETGTNEPVTLCRLNRHHPLVKRLTGWRQPGR